MVSGATPKKREGGAHGNAEKDECNAGHRPVDEGEVRAFAPDLGKRLPVEARVGCARGSGRTEKRSDETRRRIGLEVADANQDLAKLVDDGTATKALVLQDLAEYLREFHTASRRLTYRVRWRE